MATRQSALIVVGTSLHCAYIQLQVTKTWLEKVVHQTTIPSLEEQRVQEKAVQDHLPTPEREGNPKKEEEVLQRIENIMTEMKGIQKEIDSLQGYHFEGEATNKIRSWQEEG